MRWLADPAHARWLEAETDRLLEFGRAAAHDHGGFANLDDDGRPVRGARQLYVTCRMTHVYSLGALLGRPGCAHLADLGLAAIHQTFADQEHDGWFAEVDEDGRAGTGAKVAYAHAFVVLAAASATTAGRPGARALLDRALAVQDEYFWDETAGMVVEQWDRTFTTVDDYRGVNANMHTVEAYLAAADATGDQSWLDRAMRIITRVVHELARGNAWRLPEHFDSSWTALLDFNRENPADPFRPFGATIGHWFEWARLTLEARAALQAHGRDIPEWMLEDARALFDAGAAQGWEADGAPGFVYTVDWQGQPVVRERMHWVAAEAVGAAATVFAATGDERAAELYEIWWDYIDTYFIDREGGSWWHELGPDNRVSHTVWPGKADLYHAVQATLIPRLPLAPSFASALAAGLLT